MRYLTRQAWLVMAWMVLLSAPIAAQPAGRSQAVAGPPNSGNLQLVQMLKMFEGHANMTAQIRHQCRLHDDTLVGMGHYWQQGTGNQRVTRFEMQTQLAGKTASFVQVFDSEHLWTDRNFPSGRKVRRLDVAHMQSQLPNRGQGGYKKMLADASVRGGISQMLADLQYRFDFDPPRAAQFNGLPVWALIGHWRKSGLKELWPDYDVETEAGSVQEWPAQLPHHVLLLVGQNNLFPYLIEQRRFANAYLASTVTGLRPTTDPLLRYEIFNVQFAIAIDPQKFTYKSADVDWTDETSAVLAKLNMQRK